MAETNMQLADWLDDLCVRFIVNLPREELESVERICFQVEEAQWFYEDFIRAIDPSLPSMSLRAFALRIFQHCPLMSQWSHYHHSAAFSEFLAYKTRVPVRGAILLNDAMDEVVLVKGWKKNANWSFPRGKINKDEDDLDCAIREVYEETGYDIRSSGLVRDAENVKYIEINMREQNMRLYMLRGVPMDTHFEPRTRKEISKIQWYKLSDLPTLKKSKQPENGRQPAQANANKFYMVAPFLTPLKKWIAKQRKLDLARASDAGADISSNRLEAAVATATEDEAGYDSMTLSKSDYSRVASLPSDLPEVSFTHDPSSHLKRILNIGSETGTPNSTQSLMSPSHRKADSAKGNALLALLREGTETQSSGNAPIPVHPNNNAQFHGFAPTSHPNMHIQQPLPINARHAHGGQYNPHLNTGPRPPLNYAEPKPVQSAQYHHGGYMKHPVQQHAPTPPQLDQRFAGHGHPPPPPAPAPPYASNMHPAALAQQMFAANGNNRGSQRDPIHRLAPYHHTGDPQFGSTQQSPQFQMPSVPPANALPLPKLNSHSLALLNVFKSEQKKMPEITPQEVPAQPEQNAPTIGRKPRTQHQNNLLSLLKPPTSHNELGTELVTAPAKQPQPQQVKIPVILQGRQRGTESPSQLDRRTSATLTGPLNLPNFEGIKKQSPQRLPRIEKPVPKQNITILSRPVSNHNDSTMFPPPSPLPLPGPPQQQQQLQQQPKQNPRIADMVKPKKTRILRRPDKDNIDACLPNETVTVHSFTKPDLEVEEDDRPKPQIGHVPFDRRPSQSVSQKETLLSLFGKGKASPSLSASETGKKTPTLVHPPLPRFPTTASRSSSGGVMVRSKVTSPTDKAFLLGYLEDVVKGGK